MKDTLTSVILSIKPIYVQAVMLEPKKVVFRKKIFKKPVDKAFVYSSSPVKKIIGYFAVGEIVENSMQQLWGKYNKVGGIEKRTSLNITETHIKNSKINEVAVN